MLFRHWPLNGWFVSFFMCFSPFFSGCDCQITPSVANYSKPVDNFNCNLNATSPFSYVVKITDSQKTILGKKHELGTASFGALINPRSALSSAWYYRKEIKSKSFFTSGGYDRFTVYGQNIWDYLSPTGLDHPCYQSRRVIGIKLHPKADTNGERMYFDFSVIIINNNFSTSSNFLPVMSYPASPLELLLQIRYLNVQKEQGLCTIPVPKRITPKYWTFNDRIDFSSIPFHTECINYLCEQKESLANGFFDKCKTNLNARLNATVLCMIPAWTKFLEKDFPRFPTSYAGTPIVCNQSTIGMTSQIKEREDYQFTKFTQDIFYVVTLLRIYKWLQDRIYDSNYTEWATVATSKPTTQFTEFDEFTTKREPTPDWGESEFFELPDGANPFPPYVPRGMAPGAPRLLNFVIVSIYFLIAYLLFST